jgi:hypothetical protein
LTFVLPFVTLLAVNWSGWVAIAALVLSTGKWGYDFFRERYQVSLVVDLDSILGRESDKVCISLNLKIVNGSSLPVTIQGIRIEPVKGRRLDAVLVVQEPGTDVVTLRFFQKPPLVCKVRSDQIADFPLDIDPHHSKVVVLPLIASPVLPSTSIHGDTTPDLWGTLVLLGQRGKYLTRQQIHL